MTNTKKQLHKSIVNTVKQSERYRVGSDLSGKLQVPADVYHGVQTQRVINNYHVPNAKMCDYPQFIMAITYVRKAAAAVNAGLGALDKNIADHTCQAADDIIGGKLWDDFCIDMIQGGAGTSVNTGANEVTANRTLELIGYEEGDYVYCYPNDHVNRSQPTNDAYPTSLHYTAYRMNKNLLKSLKTLVDCLRVRANEFKDAAKMDRTQLQDAVPMTSGQESAAFVNTLKDEPEYTEYNAKELFTVDMGATAISTGLSAVPGYTDLITEYLTKFTGDKFVKTRDIVAATSDTGGYISYSGVPKRLAAKLSEVRNDLRLMASSPRCSLYEINLSPMTPGFSIMPGKMNPVIPEVINQVCLKVVGNDTAITVAAEARQLQLNVVEPVIVGCIFENITWVTNVMNVFREKCVSGITLNEKHNLNMVKHSIDIITALNPYIGYKDSTKVTKEALETGKSLHEIMAERNLMSAGEVGKTLDPETVLQSHNLQIWGENPDNMVGGYVIILIHPLFSLFQQQMYMIADK